MLKYLLPLSSSLIWSLSVLMAPSAIAQTGPGGSWLDGTDNWNMVDASIPEAPVYPEGSNLVNCDISKRIASLPEDVLIEAAGWSLTGSAQVHGSTTAIMAMADADGMCRPLDYQVFVFIDGEFSGTLSPTPMDSRTDGSMISFNLYRDGFIDALFNRYTPEDALCCASGQSRLFYEVERDSDRPVLVPSLPADTF